MTSYKNITPVMVPRKCLWCKKPFEARKVDVKRGWGNYCTKSCKANYQRAHGGRGPTQKLKTNKADVILDKALERDESFVEYDRICEQEDKVTITDQMLVDKAHELDSDCCLSLTSKQSSWLFDLVYDNNGKKVIKPELSPSARKFLTQIYNDNYTVESNEQF